MFYSGIADEAGEEIETQIKAHKELGWKHIEIRGAWNDNLTNISDAEFDRAVDLLYGAGLQVSCFASKIACGSRKITDPFETDVAELERAIPRMKRLKTQCLRIMSYVNDGMDDASWKKEAIRRIKELTRMAEDGGITLLHENCTGWAGQGPKETHELLREINSPVLKLLWDTGNPVWEGQNPLEYFRAVKKDVVYVHIKDYVREPQSKAVFPGDGDGAVRETIRELLSGGYDGGFSIEPHIETTPETRFSVYVEYGRRFAALLKEVQKGVKGR